MVLPQNLLAVAPVHFRLTTNPAIQLLDRNCLSLIPLFRKTARKVPRIRVKRLQHKLLLNQEPHIQSFVSVLTKIVRTPRWNALPLPPALSLLHPSKSAETSRPVEPTTVITRSPPAVSRIKSHISRSEIARIVVPAWRGSIPVIAACYTQPWPVASPLARKVLLRDWQERLLTVRRVHFLLVHKRKSQLGLRSQNCGAAPG